MDRPSGVAGFKYLKMNREEKERLLKRLGETLKNTGGVLFAYVYGGFVERMVFRDVDVAVWVENPREAFKYEVDLSARLEADLGVPVDIHVVNEAPLPLKHTVFTGGRLLFSSDEETRVRIVDETIRQYADLRILQSLG
ncbi:MAG: nucleotidyltransferase domain-containing protein [Candidatus Brockarchaeota archaeon]|nr:nucleotidyltransferase domain-containing protein [Candidatus Brockarchaeota archaeon]